jgi:hypothetical protein
MDGMNMEIGDLLGMGQLDSDERPLMELARERAATVAAEQMASPSVMMPVDENVPGMSTMGEEPVGLGPELELAYAPVREPEPGQLQCEQTQALKEEDLV